MGTMKAVVIHEAGGPDVLELETRPIPKAEFGEVLIRIKAFGLDRSELFTRRGLSPNVKFPRILGIEGVGIVEEAPGNEFEPGDIVATAMGGMGRDVDGSYPAFTCAGSPGAVDHDVVAVGNVGRHPRDDADSPGVVVQVASPREGRATADSWRVDAHHVPIVDRAVSHNPHQGLI